MPATMKHSFANVMPPQIQRSLFQRPTGTLTAFDAGQLIPILVDEILPGDTVDLNGNYICRLNTLIHPAFANMYLDVHFFYCPNRVLWQNWEGLNGASDNAGVETTDYNVPQISASPSYDANLGSLWDYFGLPLISTLSQSDMPIALPFRMYAKVFNDWYRDQNLQAPIAIPTGDGPDALTLYPVLRRNKKKDYFNSALPWPQKGDSVAIPLGVTAPVYGDGKTMGFELGYPGSSTKYGLGWSSAGTDLRMWSGIYNTTLPSTPTWGTDPGGTQYKVGLTTESGKSGIIADLTNASAITINALRQAISMQQMLERDARGGTRYTEILKAHFGVDVPDYRLQRPQYLGGHTTRIDIRAVSQTSATAATPQGNQAAYSITPLQGNIKQTFVEHGFLMAIASVRHDIQYQQGMRKMWSRRSREEFYDPIFAHLGEQAILNKELYVQTSSVTNNQVFGYQERWSEYRYFPAQITGIMRSGVAGSLANWHLAEYYGSLPVLNEGFIMEQPDVDRIIAVPSEPHFILDAYFDVKHYRPIPIFSTPGLDRI